MDYFTSVLPRAQYGDESAASVSFDRATTYFKIRDAADSTIGAVFSGSSATSGDDLQKVNQPPTSIPEGYVAPVS